MTGSVALDVVIGLVFIYLLYSLLASIIQEIIANFLGLRARNLRHGLSRMLKDAPKTEGNNILSRATIDSKERLKRNFLKDDDNLLKTFYQQPLIKYLASGNYFSKPSYISNSDFSKAILDILKKQADPSVPPVDTIRETLSNDNPLIGPETRTHLLSLLDDAQNDLVRFRANLENWFDNTMERVTGWYRRTVQWILMLIGFVLAISFNINTITITELLAIDEDARNQMVALASTYMEENEKLIDLYEKEKENDEIAPNPKDSLELTKPETTTEIDDYDTKLDSLLQIKAALERDIENANQVLGFRPPEILSAKLWDSKTSKETAKQRIISKCDTKYLVEFPSAFLAEKTEKYYSIQEEERNGIQVVHAEFNDLEFIWANLWGYLITALAISLGAPFWFDLLSKLMKIRGSTPNRSSNTATDVATPKGALTVNQRVG